MAQRVKTSMEPVVLSFLCFRARDKSLYTLPIVPIQMWKFGMSYFSHCDVSTEGPQVRILSNGSPRTTDHSIS
jgi:hypothetical protein